MFTAAYLRDRANRFRDLARRAGNIEDARYLLELATDADRQAETHDEQVAPTRSLRLLIGPRREDIVGLYGTIYRALPPDLAEQLKSLDTTNGIRVTLRTGETFWFMPNTTVKAIVARVVEETSRCRRHDGPS